MERTTFGPIMIPVDDSPPHWSLILALAGEKPDLAFIQQAIPEDQIPVVMTFKKVEKAEARQRRTRTASPNVNDAGWKLGHIRRVGLNNKNRLEKMDIQVLQDHLIHRMSPSNMFLVPKFLSGIAERNIIIKAIRRHKEKPEFIHEVHEAHEEETNP